MKYDKLNFTETGLIVIDSILHEVDTAGLNNDRSEKWNWTDSLPGVVHSSVDLINKRAQDAASFINALIQEIKRLQKINTNGDEKSVGQII